jgi:hypothetical protein
MVDEDFTVRATVGSGNLTFGGWGYNTEVLDVLIPGTDSNCFADLAGFLEAVAEAAGPGGRLGIERLPDLGRFVETCQRASRAPGSGNSRLLHTVSEPLDVQLGRVARELGGATSLTVVSPFFSGHVGVMHLARALSCERISVAVPPVAPAIFDFASFRQASFSVSPVACDLFSDTRSPPREALRHRMPPGSDYCRGKRQCHNGRRIRPECGGGRHAHRRERDLARLETVRDA